MVCLRSLLALILMSFSTRLPAPTFVGDGYMFHGSLDVACATAEEFFGELSSSADVQTCLIDLRMDDQHLWFGIRGDAEDSYSVFGVRRGMCIAFDMNGIEREACSRSQHIWVEGLGHFLSLQPY